MNLKLKILNLKLDPRSQKLYLKNCKLKLKTK